MVEEAKKPIEGLKNLQRGFMLSFASLVLFAFLLLGPRLVYSLFTMSIVVVMIMYGLPFLVLFVWAIGVFMRAKGWRLLGHKRVGGVLSLSGRVVLLFVLLPLLVSLVGLPFGGYQLVFGHPLPLLVAVVTSLAWGYSTCSEVRGFEELEKENKISLKLPRFCSLIGVLVYACSVVGGFAYTVGFEAYPFYYFPFILDFSILFISMLIASPLLIVSCLDMIARLGQLLSRQAAIA
jgi:hypothetical protein